MNREGSPTHAASALPDSFLGVASDIADQLANQAIWHNDHCTWLGYDVDEDAGQWRSVYRTIDDSLYAGLPGVALFLARMWAQGGNPEHARAANGALREAARLLRERRGVTLHGWYNGLAGSVWAMRTAFDLLPESAPHDHADLLEEIRAAPVPQDGVFDLISGASGTILGLMATADPGDPALSRCADLAQWLLDTSQNGPGIGLSWREPSAAPDVYPPCGLAHGASSGALALLSYGIAADQPRYIEAAFDCFLYERQWFDRPHCGWPDLREVTPQNAARKTAEPPPTYWCYGAGGIGLARLQAWQLTGNPTALAEANAALFACKTRARSALAALTAQAETPRDFDLNASLCHGLGSLLETLLYSARLGHDPQALPLARQLGRAMVAKAQGEWPCGVVGGGSAPGLMLGLAGIGTMFLGLHDPQEFTPSGLPPAAPPQ